MHPCRTLLLPCLVAALTGMSLAAKTPADVVPECGMVVTTDVSFSSDLVCRGSALIVGADDVVIDLKGHRLSAPGDWEHFAVLNDGHDDVTITNGVIEGVILLDNGCERNILSGLLFLGDPDGPGSRRTYVDLDDSTSGYIQDNAFFHSDLVFSENIGSASYLVSRNTFEYAFIWVQGFGHIIRDNWIHHGGISNDEGHGLQFLGNRITNGFIETRDVGGGTVISGNDIDGSLDWTGHPIPGILVGDCHEAPGPGSVRVVGNRVMHATLDGIFMDSDCSEGNSYVAGNLALFNGGIGINVPGEPVDGGRNRSRHNGGSAQCLGVDCR